MSQETWNSCNGCGTLSRKASNRGPPKVVLAAPHKLKLRDALRRCVKVKIGCTEDCTVTLKLRLKRKAVAVGKPFRKPARPDTPFHRHQAQARGEAARPRGQSEDNASGQGDRWRWQWHKPHAPHHGEALGRRSIQDTSGPESVVERQSRAGDGFCLQHGCLTLR